MVKKHPHYGRNHNPGNGRDSNPPPCFQQVDQRRPHQVELLFHRQCPEMVELDRRVRHHGMERPQHQVPRIRQQFHQLHPVQHPAAHQHDRAPQQDRPVIERKNAQRAPRVEVAEVPRRVPRVVQNARNQKPGKNEEQRHARPSHVAQQIARQQDRIAPRVRARPQEVDAEHQQNRQSANAIERRNVLACRRGVDGAGVASSRVLCHNKNLAHPGPAAPGARPALVVA